MAKVGYIFKADLYEGFDADKEVDATIRVHTGRRGIG